MNDKWSGYQSTPPVAYETNNVAWHGRSMEEARLILGEAVEREAALAKGLGTALHELFKPFGDMELDIPPREHPRFE